MSTFLYIYPVYKTAEFLEMEQKNLKTAEHWLVFWILSFIFNLITFLPVWISGALVVLMYFPETTDFCRKIIVEEVTPKTKQLVAIISEKFDTRRIEEGKSKLGFLKFW